MLTPRQEHMANWVVKQLKKAPENTISRQRLWRLYRVDKDTHVEDNSAAFSGALKTAMSNGKIQVVFIDAVKHIKLV